MLAVLDAATVARLQALVAMAVPAAAASLVPAVSERQALMLEGITEMKEKAKKTLSPEHLAKMKAGREAAALKKQLLVDAEVAAIEATVEANVVAALAAAPLVAAAPLAPVVAEVPVAALAPATMKGSKKGQPTAWADWVKKVMAERKDEIAAYKEAAEQKTGASLKWIAANLGKTSPEWLAFKAAWAAMQPQEHAELQAPPVSAATSDDEDAVVAAPVVAAPVAAVAAPVDVVAAPMASPKPVKKRGPKPMVEMSADELKAFLEAKKAKKATAAATAAASAADAETEPDEPEPVVTPPIAKKRGPKPLATMTADERAAHDAKVAERKVAKEAKARAAEAALALVAQMQVAH
jgi:ribonuclease E